MIPKSFTGAMLKGRRAILERDTQNRAGCGVGTGATVTIIGVVKGKGLEIKTDKCPHCKQYSIIRGVSRDSLILLPDKEGGKA